MNSNYMSVIIHGGGGKYYPKRTRSKLPYLRESLHAAWDALEAGQAAEAAAVAAINVLEGSEYFNAGYGSYPNVEGLVLQDVGLMRGMDRHFVSLMNIKKITFPSTFALDLLSETESISTLWTDELMRKVDTADDETKKRYGWVQSYEQLVSPEVVEMLKSKEGEFTKTGGTHGTVGCVVRDAQGKIAACTSTGGTVTKKSGRVGDSPIIGAGVFADNEVCGLSTTGHGESFLKSLTSGYIIGKVRDALNNNQHAFLEKPEILQDICENELKELERKCSGRGGGIIIIPKLGKPIYSFISEQISIAMKDHEDEDYFIATKQKGLIREE